MLFPWKYFPWAAIHRWTRCSQIDISARSLQPVWSSVCSLHSFVFVLRTFLNLERRGKVTGTEVRWIRGWRTTWMPFEVKPPWWRGQYEMGRFHDGVPICLQYSVSCEWPIFWAFQGRLYRKNIVDSFSAGTNLCGQSLAVLLVSLHFSHT